MTSQTKHYIELSDILGLRFECAACNASVSFPLSQKFDLEKLSDCPGCSKTWVTFPMGPSIRGEIETLIRAITQLGGALTPDSKFPTKLVLRLEIAASPRADT